jgi:hypothetical protein
MDSSVLIYIRKPNQLWQRMQLAFVEPLIWLERLKPIHI